MECAEVIENSEYSGEVKAWFRKKKDNLKVRAYTAKMEKLGKGINIGSRVRDDVFYIE